MSLAADGTRRLCRRLLDRLSEKEATDVLLDLVAENLAFRDAYEETLQSEGWVMPA